MTIMLSWAVLVTAVTIELQSCVCSNHDIQFETGGSNSESSVCPNNILNRFRTKQHVEGKVRIPSKNSNNGFETSGSSFHSSDDGHRSSYRHCSLDSDFNDKDLLNILYNSDILNHDADFKEYLRRGNLQLIIFYSSDYLKKLPEEKLQNFISFLRNFDYAHEHLSHYNISLGFGNCTAGLSVGHCSKSKIGEVLYGFQNGEEKIGFPIETLYSLDSVVASALHLSLLYTVPIIQSLVERKTLEAKCRHKCDIILAHHRSLGTHEHRHFLEASVAFLQESLKFALTTYPAGVYGLPESPLHKSDSYNEIESSIFVLHCSGDGGPSRRTVDASVEGDPCDIVSHYPGQVSDVQFLDFLKAFTLPLWHDVIPSDVKFYPAACQENKDSQHCVVNELTEGKVTITTPYDDVSMPWAVFVYDENTSGRVQDLVPSLARMLRGLVALVTLKRSLLTPELEKYLRTESQILKVPAVLFFDKFHTQGFSPYLNEYTNAYDWIIEQFSLHKRDMLRYEHEMLQMANSHTEEEFEDDFEIDELRQDDEMAREMVPESQLTFVVQVNGKEHLDNILKENGQNGPVIPVAFYLSWDPVSNILLQHLNKLPFLLGENRHSFSVYRVNCYDWPKICDHHQVDTYPVLQLFRANETKLIYNGPTESSHILKSVLLVECHDNIHRPFELSSEEELRGFLEHGLSCSASRNTEAFIAGIFSTEENYKHILPIYEQLYGYKMISALINEEVTKRRCGLEQGCFVISKPKDKFQPLVTIANSDSRSEQNSKIRHWSELVFAPLDSYRIELANIPASVGKQTMSLSFILILRHEEHSGKSEADEEHEYYSKVGTVAAKISRPGIVFSYLGGEDELRDEMVSIYGLDPRHIHLIAVERSRGQVIVYKDSGVISEKKITEWVGDVINNNVEPSVHLPQRDWGPEVEAFDYVKYIEEDFLRQAEDQFAMDTDLDFGGEISSKGNKKAS